MRLATPSSARTRTANERWRALNASGRAGSSDPALQGPVDLSVAMKAIAAQVIDSHAVERSGVGARIAGRATTHGPPIQTRSRRPPRQRRASGTPLGVLDEGLLRYPSAGRTRTFDGETMRLAVAATFERRGIEIPSERPLALTSDFAEDGKKKVQWTAFGRRTRRPDLHDLPAIIAALDRFLWPMLQAAARRETWPDTWTNGGPWKES
jgi:hypothetical protein